MKSPLSFARVGELACQRDTFLRELCARVVSCKAVSLDKTLRGGKNDNSKKNNSNNNNNNNNNNNTGATSQFTDPQSAFDVILTDSVLFPEGGGQPCDYGELICDEASVAQPLPVRQVRRVGDACVVRVPAALPVGAAVQLRVDDRRRRDHTQHHSAQHLITAMLLSPRVMGEGQTLPTIAWALAHPHCHVVLPTGVRLTPAVVARVEAACNEAIAQCVPVQCEVFPSREAYVEARKLQEEKKEGEGDVKNPQRVSREIPQDVTGPIRIITIDGVDSCTCCGTHVTNLAQLQMIKLLHQETKGDTLKLFFIAGDRVREYFSDMYFREKELMKEMGGVRPEDFVATAIRKGKDFVDMEKRVKNLTMELMKLESARLILELTQSSEKGDDDHILMYRRDDVEAEFFAQLRDAIRQTFPECHGVFAWPASPSTSSNIKNGQFMIFGPTEWVDKVAPEVCTALEGRGGMSKHGYRGKGTLTGWDNLVKKLSPC
ncbi:Threonyl/alanyl tRNA synthetase [Trypanosoma melophagium]|uniref:Threonyl/alanyl tRNA synthetase n=1 Tax=Trypanosoma melophagium TaxID=715481 RepID=UPI00351A7F8B|nr:Threonyl/alanyl tRNA synthetase [Trypanosoma melophagium]